MAEPGVRAVQGQRQPDTPESRQMDGGKRLAIDSDRQQELQSGRQVLDQAHRGQAQALGRLEKH